MSVGVSTRKNIIDLLGIVNSFLLQWKVEGLYETEKTGQNRTDFHYLSHPVNVDSDSGMLH